MNNHYPVHFKLVKQFTKGNLKGMTHTETMGFTSTADAHDWFRRINENNKRGYVNYKVTHFNQVK